MKVAVGCDHRGLDYKKYVSDWLIHNGHNPQDFGTFTSQSVDYPDIAGAVCEAVVSSRCDYGILICGTGIGMSIAANKTEGIRAALCCDVFSAQRSRAHNNANVICLGAERGENGVAEILHAFFNTPFEGGRHQLRLNKISALENRSHQ
jgi:ribose 5-phosphate isomerase B